MLGVFTVMLALILVSPVLARLFGEPDLPGSPLEPLARSHDPYESVMFKILALALAPLGEEFLFRGLFYNALRQRIPVILAVVFQAVVFGVLHPFDPYNAALVAVVALGLGAMYEWRKTLLAPVLMHALTNGLMLVLIAWGLTAGSNAPRLGVVGSAHERGFMVREVAPGSAAEEAGLRAGDVVTAVDGTPVKDFSGLSRIIRAKKLGDEIVVEFLRGSEVHRVPAVLKILPP